MELEGRKERVDTGKSSRTWNVSTVSLRLAVLNVFQGFFGPKMAVFGPKLQFLKLRSTTCGPRSRPPLSSFLLKLCVIVLHTHRYHPTKFRLNLKHHDGVLIFAHFARAARLLLAACCLLLAAAKPGGSTLDTKKGYKTKTGSTSSVTLTLGLIKTEYWDRAGGGGNIRGVLKGRDFFFLLRTALKDRPKGPPTANRQLPLTANRHQPPTTNRHQPTATNRRQPPAATNCQLPTTANCLQPPTASHQPPPTTTNRHQPPVANCQPPTAANRQPPTATNHG